MSYRVALVDYSPVLFDLTPALRSPMEQILASVGATLEVAQCRTEADVLQMAADADLVMIQSLRQLLTGKIIAGLNRCRGIMRLGVGYDSIDVAAATAYGIPVSNVVGWCDDEVAEHAIGLLLAGIRRLSVLDRRVKAGEWPKEAIVPTHRLCGKTVGIIGFGPIGRAVAKRLSGFGLTLLVYDPYVTGETVVCCGAEPVTLGELLARADCITLHPRLTPESYHLLGQAEFAAMKPGVYIVNTSRGAIIDEPALAAALQTGSVAGAALDVMEEEPLPLDSPLRNYDNVILTPHLASYSSEAVATLYRFSAEIAADLLSQHWVRTIVNPEVRPQAEARWGAYQSLDIS